jgi:hypothetical protein
VGITAGSREVPGRNACDKRQPYRIIIIIIIMNVVHETYDHTGNNWCHRSSKKGLKKHLEDIPRNHSMVSLQQPAMLGTSHIVLEILQSGILSLAVGANFGSRAVSVEGGEGRPVTRDNDKTTAAATRTT